MVLHDWVRCPEHSCPVAVSNGQKVKIDVADHDWKCFVSFQCNECGYGSLEDDLEWWVRCPNCMSEEDHPFPAREITANVNREGQIEFECESCGFVEREYPKTRWDS